MKKTLLGFAIFIITAISCIASAGAESYDGYEYTVLQDNTVEIIGYSGDKTELELPATIGGRKVSSIGDYAFYGYSALESVVIPENVTSIGINAFSDCTSLTIITLADTVTEIGANAFSGCSSLLSAELPDNVASIGAYTFSDCTSLMSVSIPDNATSIGECAFYNCSSLDTIMIPTGIIDIADYAFLNCSSLEAIGVDAQNEKYSSKDGVLLSKDESRLIIYPAGKTDSSYSLPEGVTAIEENAFSSCEKLEAVTIPDSVLKIGSKAFKGCTALVSINIPKGVSVIEQYAFAGCFSLKDIAISEGVTSIYNNAFEFCEAIRSIDLPDSITYIGDSAFLGCYSLEAITIPAGITDISGNTFRYCEKLQSVTIPDGVKRIGENAFYGCSSLNAIDLPDSVTDIGAYAFSGCSSLQSVILPNKITKIEKGVFCDCSALLSMNIPEGVTVIGENAFKNCTSLEAVNIPKSVKAIGLSVFYNTAIVNRQATAVKYIGEWVVDCNPKTKGASIRSGVRFISESAFEDCNLMATISIPAGVVDIGERAFRNCTALKTVVIPKGVTEIKPRTFENCTSLTSVVISDTVTRISDRAFYNCSSINEITIPDSVQAIGINVFYKTAVLNSQSDAIKYVDNWLVGCDKKLTSAAIKDGTRGIADSSFINCSSLKTVTMPDSVTYIGAGAFQGCSALTSVTIPKNATTIREATFTDCTSLKSVAIPDTVTVIEDGAFARCRELTSVTIPGSVITIGNGAFHNCNGLTSVVLDNGIKNIGNYAFGYCTALTSVTLTESITDIGYNCFEYCKSLKAVTIPAQIKSISEAAFRNCTALSSVTIKDGVEEIKGYAFFDCPQLTAITIPESVTEIGVYALGYYTDSDTRENTKVEGFAISCNEDSAAHKYATDNEIDYKLLIPSISGFGVNSRNYNSITLGWEENPAADGYIIQQYKNNTWVTIGNIKNNAATSMAVENLEASTSYKFRAVAYSVKDNVTSYSRYTPAITVATAPAQITGFAVKDAGEDYLILGWDKHSDASGFVIQEQVDGVWKHIATIKIPDAVSYKITGLNSGTLYRYRMVAYKNDTNGTCYGKYTASLSGYTCPRAVTDFEVTGTGTVSVTVSWNATSFADGYIIDICEDGSWRELARVTGDTNTYKATGLTLGKTYEFRIRSYITNGTNTIYSSYSSSVSGAPALEKVENLRMTNRGTDFISVRWDKNENADGYMVYIYDGSAWKCVKTLTSPNAVSHKITGLESGKAYKITVKAYKTVDGTKYISDTSTISANTL
ncbi:MAG: leucine-rich repeat protein [Ruminiclostridium sp.]|nr:leucine-rich repeat protein [Ruminiclostridium sp.]